MYNIQVLDSLRTKLLLMTKAQLKCALDVLTLKGKKNAQTHTHTHTHTPKKTIIIDLKTLPEAQWHLRTFALIDFTYPYCTCNSCRNVMSHQALSVRTEVECKQIQRWRACNIYAHTKVFFNAR